MADVAVQKYPNSKDEGSIIALAMSNVKLYAGTMIGTNTAGYAVNGNDAAADIKILGVATETVDNSGGSAGDLKIKVKAGTFLLEHGGTITQTMVGEVACAKFNYTLNIAANCTHNNHAGMVVEYVSATQAWIKMGPAMAENIVAAG